MKGIGPLMLRPSFRWLMRLSTKGEIRKKRNEEKDRRRLCAHGQDHLSSLSKSEEEEER